MTAEWISVEESLPEDRVATLVFPSPAGKVYEGAWRSNGRWWSRDYSAGQLKDGGITHWMPLPDPPKTKEPQ